MPDRAVITSQVVVRESVIDSSGRRRIQNRRGVRKHIPNLFIFDSQERTRGIGSDILQLQDLFRFGANEGYPDGGKHNHISIGRVIFLQHIGTGCARDGNSQSGCFKKPYAVLDSAFAKYDNMPSGGVGWLGGSVRDGGGSYQGFRAARSIRVSPWIFFLTVVSVFSRAK